MFIDIHVLPAFYEPINGDESKEDLRHEALDIHLNGIAKLEHIKNQMRCAGLDKMALLAQDYSSEHGEPIVSNDEIRTLVDCEPDEFNFVLWKDSSPLPNFRVCIRQAWRVRSSTAAAIIRRQDDIFMILSFPNVRCGKSTCTALKLP